MAAFLLFMLQLIISGIAFQQTAGKSELAKPGCPEKCGNLTIAYPFGIGKAGCYLDEHFRVECNKSTHVATLPHVYGTTVFNISSDSITVETNAVSFYYNKTSGKNLTDSSNGNIIIGCASLCYSSWNVKDRHPLTSQPDFSSLPSCSGYGCCQTLIQKKLGNFETAVHTMNTEGSAWTSNKCSRVMIAEKSFSKFNEFNFSDCDARYMYQLSSW